MISFLLFPMGWVLVWAAFKLSCVFYFQEAVVLIVLCVLFPRYY
jgi:hypothetical protein